MPTPRVIDLSHHNSIPKDLLAAKQAGIIGVIHKLTEGKSYIDHKVQARHHLAAQAGLAWGLYHFLRPGDMAGQAHFFIETANALEVLDEDTLLAADHEDAGVSYADLIAFLEAVEHLSGHVPVIYSGHLLKEQVEDYPDEYRLWLAQYASSPTLPKGCEKYYLWQYSDQGEVPGIDPPTDVNTFEGDADEFLKAWSGTRDVPEPDEDETVVTFKVSANKPTQLIVEFEGNVTLIGRRKP